MTVKSISAKAAKWCFNNYTMEEVRFFSNTSKKAKRLRPNLKIDLQILIPEAFVERAHSGGSLLSSLSPSFVNQRTGIKSSSKSDNAHHSMMRKEIRLTTFLSTQFSVIIGLIKQSGGPNPGAQAQTHDQAVVVVIWPSQPESNLFICVFNPLLQLSEGNGRAAKVSLLDFIGFTWNYRGGCRS